MEINELTTNLVTEDMVITKPSNLISSRPNQTPNKPLPSPTIHGKKGAPSSPSPKRTIYSSGPMDDLSN